MPLPNPVAFFQRHSQSGLRKSLRFALRYRLIRLVYGPSQLSDYLMAHQAEFDPVLLCKVLETPHRLFYDRRLSPSAVDQLVLNHHRSLSRGFPAQARLALLRFEPAPLASITGKSGETFQLTLDSDFQMEKEGCLNLTLHDADGVLLRTSFVLNQDPGAPEDGGHKPGQVCIGCIQSSPHDTAARLKRATKAFFGLQPRFLSVELVKMLGEALGIAQVEGIASEHHVYRSFRYRKAIRVDYSELWSQMGFERGPNGNFQTPARLVLKDINEYPSNKRSEYRQRQQLLLALQQDLSTFFGTSAAETRPSPALGRP